MIGRIAKRLSNGAFSFDRCIIARMNTLPFSYREVLRKYSPDEARDSHGEWTDGGSSTTGNGATAQAGRPDAAALPSYERGHVPGAASAVGLHFSTGKRDALDSNHYGTGYKGAERERINKPGVDPRLKQRAYFYVNEGHGTFPESGVGPYRHDVRLTNLYDPAKDGAAVWRQGHGDMNASESAVLNAGYDGYLVHSPSPSAGQGYAVLLGPHHIPVRFLGMGKLAKYSDTEARNSKGEWTTGGTALDEGDPHDHQGMLRVTKENREALVAMLHDQTPKWGSEKEADATHLLDMLLHFAYAPNGTTNPATRAVTIDKGRIVSGAQWRKDGGGNTIKVELVASLVKGEGDLWMNRIEKDAAALHRNVWLEATPKAVDFYARRGYERSKATPSEKSLTPMVKSYSKIGQATKADAPDDEPIGVLCASGAYAAKLVAGKVSLGLLRKYSPDQPRDANGRWGTGPGQIDRRVPYDQGFYDRRGNTTDGGKDTPTQPSLFKPGNRPRNVAQTAQPVTVRGQRVAVEPAPATVGQSVQNLTYNNITSAISENPDWVTFHGTSDAVVASVMKDGLIPKGSPGGDDWASKHGMTLDHIDGHDASVFMTSDQEHAAMYAKAAAEMKGGTPVLLEIHVPREAQQYFRRDELDELAIRTLPGLPKIPPEWIVSATPLRGGRSLDHYFAAAKADGAAPLVIYAVIMCDESTGKVSLGLLRKYSPNQPRDAHGMWTSGPTINYEVAPDPHDAALTARWSRLTDAEKTTLSQHVAQQVAPEVLAAAGITGQSVMQSGGYMGSTNPSIAVNVDGNASGDKVVQAADLLGYALSQDSMMVTSAHAFPGADPVGIITVHIGKADPAAVYDKLWQLQDNGDHLVGGHSTLNGQMNILNFSHLSTEELASRIDAHLSGAYQVDVRQGFAAFPQKADYGQSLPSGFALSAGQSSSQGGADRMRAEANRLIEKELSRIGKVNLAQALKKYAPDQPRDAHGRFADGAVQALFNDNLGISRANMPQVPGRFLPQFLDSLKARGIGATREEVRPASLKATQKDFDPADIKRAVSAPMDIKARPLLVSQDNRVLDGHHRWAGMVLNNDPTAHILRLGLNAKEALDAVRQFSTENDIPARTAKVDLALALLKYSPDQPRDSDGRFAGGGPIADQIPRDATGALNGRQRVAETHFAEQVSKDPAAALEAYSKLPEAMGGKYINTDTARELSPHYRANPTDMSAAVQEPASWLMKQAYAKQLAMPPVSNSVVFTAGGSGAGKTSAVQGLPAMQRLTDMADVVTDGNLANFPSATKRIDQALATGRDVHIVWVGRDPVDAFQNGVLPRAMKEGRTVPIDWHAALSQGSVKTIGEIAAHYAGNPHVTIHYIDNTHGWGKAVLGDASLPSKLDFGNIKGKLNDILESEYRSGKISRSVYEGTRSHG